MNFLTRIEGWLLALSVAGYFGATVGVWIALVLRVRDDGQTSMNIEARERKSERAMQLGRSALLLAVGAHAASLLGQGSAVLGVRAGTVGLFGFVLAGFALCLKREQPRDYGGEAVVGAQTSAGAVLLPIALVAASFSLLAPGLHAGASSGPQLATVFLALHVLVFVGAYVALAWAFAASLVYMLGETLLKRRRAGVLRAKLPPLSVADGWIYRATLFGAGLLTLGLATSVALYVARPVAMSPLGDPKVVVSLLTWGAFAMALVARWLGWRGRRVHLVVVCGFVLMAISFLGTPHFLNAR